MSHSISNTWRLAQSPRKSSGIESDRRSSCTARTRNSPVSFSRSERQSLSSAISPDIVLESFQFEGLSLRAYGAQGVSAVSIAGSAMRFRPSKTMFPACGPDVIKLVKTPCPGSLLPPWGHARVALSC